MRPNAGQCVVVTGAARGVGRAVSQAFAAAGANIAIADLCETPAGCPYGLGTRAQLSETADACRGLGATVLEYVLDVRDREQVQAAVLAAMREFGSVDVLVNNAGVVAPAGKRVHEFSDDEWEFIHQTNLYGPFNMARAVLPHMLAKRGGVIVNVASTAGLVAFTYFGAYVSAKHGLVGLTKAMAADYASSGIRVNAVCPGLIEDRPELGGAMLAAVAEALRIPLDAYVQAFEQAHPLNRTVAPDTVAAAIRWLASNEAKHITGAVLPIDWGFVAK